MDHNKLITPYGRSGESQDYNFTVYGGRNRWTVSRTLLGPFYANYCKTLNEVLTEYRDSPPCDGDARALGGIMERSLPDMPIIIDMLLKFETEPDSVYDEFFVKQIVANIQHCIYEKYMIDRSSANQILMCVIAETEEGFTLIDGKHKYQAYQIRFYFPFFRVEAKTIDSLMHSIQKQMRNKNIIGALNQAPVGDWRDIMKAYINTPVPMYGCSEKPEYPPVILDTIYSDLSDLIEDEDGLTEVESLSVEDVFDIEEHALIVSRQVAEDIFDDLDNEDLLPFFLSLSYVNNTIATRDTESVNITTPQTRGSLADHHSLHRTKSAKEIVLDMLNLISNDRYYNKCTWLDIGKAIHTVYRNSEEGLSVWIAATEKAMSKVKFLLPHFQDISYSQACRDAYFDFPEPTNVTERTLAWLAKEDNPEGYNAWHSVWVLPYRQQALDLSHDSIAKALYCEIWLTYACYVKGKIRSVYLYENNRWVKAEDGWQIRNKISDDFRDVFEKERHELSAQITTTNDLREKNRIEETHTIVCKVIAMLKNRSTKSQILAEVLDRITIPNFVDLLDKNGTLTGHPNGVTEVDIDTGYINFRKGRPEDYISRVTKAKFDNNMSWEHPRVKDFMDWMSEMFIDDQTRHFVMKLFSTGFVAGNYDKIGPFFSGNLNNGKSTLSNFIIRCWGAYAVKFPTTGITRGYADSGAANPALVRISGPRWGLADEPDAKERLHSGPFKRVFGNDDFYQRGLYSEGGDLENTCTVTVWANRIPPFPDADNACRIRFCCVPCLTTYVKTGAPESREEQLAQRIVPMRKSFQTKVNRLTSAALWVWHQYFPIWCKESLDYRPPEIENATLEYWKENDVYNMYISDRIEVSSDPNDTLTITQIYKDFEVWFTMYNKGEQVPDRPTLRYQLIQHWAKGPVDNRWAGIRFKQEGDDFVSKMTSTIAGTTLSRPETKKEPIEGYIPQPMNLDFGTVPQASSSKLKVELIDGKIVTRPITNEDPIELTTV